MGLFSSKKKTYVSSVIYNMAGPEEDRPQFLKTIILGNMVGNKNFNVVETIQNGYKTGGGTKLRRFYNWAENNFPEADIPNDTIRSIRELSISEVEAAISSVVGTPVEVSWVEAGSVDPTYWAMKWMYENLPNRVHDDWTAEFNYEFGEDPNDKQIVITFADGVTIPIVVNINDYYKGSYYIYALYRQDTGAVLHPLVVGATIDLGSTGEFPDLTGWRSVGDQETPRTARLVRKVSTTSGGTTTVVETVETETFNEYVGMHTKANYMGTIDGRRFDRTQYLRLHQTYVIQKQTTVVGSVTTEQDVLVRSRDYRIDTQERTLTVWGNPKIFIYQTGVGGPLDHLLSQYEVGDGYFPLIPLRLNNEFIGESNYPDLYESSKKAYKKAFSSSIDELIDKIGDNAQVGEIDFAYVVFGVSLNTKENACKKYIYNYFHKLARIGVVYPPDINGWESRYNAYTSDRHAWDTWVADQELTIDENGEISGGSINSPRIPGFSTPPSTNARIKTSDKVLNFDMEIDWETVIETKGTGLAQPGIKPGELSIIPTGHTTATFFHLFSNEREDLKRNELKIWWQLTADSWKCLTITGLVHKNHIWNGKSVEITSAEAFEDIDEENGESGFVIPLHAQVFKEMSLVDATQMSTACTYLMFNCYQVVKKKWYQRGWFQVLIIIAIVVLTILYPPAGGAAAIPGVLGTAGAVGAAIGLTGIAAIIAGLVANMIAAMILTRLVTYVAVEVLGEKIGQIVAVIASFIALNVATAMQAGQTMSSMWANMMSAQNLMQLTSSVGNGIAGFIQAGTSDYMQRAQELLDQYERESDELQERYAQNVGYANSIIDPFRLTEAGQAQFQLESPNSFLSRTLMTGSDIADISMNMLTNFADLTLRLDLQT